MRICTQCNAQSPDSALYCINCQADLNEFSRTSTALKRLRANPRVVTVRLVVAANCCPACRKMEGTYTKDQVPNLPIEGCSYALGCRCFYEPMLSEIYP